MAELIPPHGGELVNRILTENAREQAQERARGLPRVVLNSRQASDLELIAVGAFSPLTGFMVQQDYLRVVEEGRLADGLPWSMPITLAVEQGAAASLEVGQEVALFGPRGDVPLALLGLSEKYRYDKAKEARLVYGTEEEAHPGVAALYAQGEVLLGGEISLINRPAVPPDFKDYWLDPVQTREIFRSRGWRRVVGFQTRNPVHRAHEYLQKCAMEIVDGLLLHPLVGETQEGDIPAQVRMRCYQVLLDGYYPKERVVLSVLPAAMRYAGPREAIFHALVRKNYGCTHFVVGRDHAGVGSYYGTYDAHRAFDEFSQEELGITPLLFDHAFYCQKCGSMATDKTCPHPGEDHLFLSGTKVRELLAKGRSLPREFSRPEVAEVLLEWAREQALEVS